MSSVVLSRRRRAWSLAAVAVVSLTAYVAVCLPVPTAAASSAREDAQPATVSFESIVERARELSTRAYEGAETGLPPVLAELGYDGYRDIRFRPESSLLRGDPSGFEVQLFHCGYLFRSPVAIHVVTGGESRRAPYRASDFEFGPRADLGAVELPEDLGFAGFRVHCALNRPDYKDELVAFLGASYFRMLSRGQVYGISARGLAIDTGEPKGEEFPSFREFWIEPLADGAIRVFALLDSRSLTGAYEFTIRPGDPTTAGVRVALFARTKVEKLGIAPLTSMFLFGEDRVRPFPDYRPEVHDSDALLIRNGESSWSLRPLGNPRRVHRLSRFDGNDLTGFGLLQRDRVYENYQDLESRFELRPSLWIVPTAGFDDGFVELVEIPTIEEIHDNIVAYFVPRGSVAAGERRDFAYVIEAPSGDPGRAEVAYRVRSTRVHARGAGEPSLFVVDFDSPPGNGDEALPIAEARCGEGEIANLVVLRNAAAGGVRVSFEWKGDADRVELALVLKRDGEPCGERWVYAYEHP